MSPFLVSKTSSDADPEFRDSQAGYLIVLLFGLFLLSSCSGNRATATQGQVGVPVLAAAAVRKAVPVEITAIGNVEAYSTVAVKTLVGGELTEVHFKEGQDVRQGDMLFTIDPRPFEATLKQAEANLARDTAFLKQSEANLARDEAQAKNAEVQARRYGDLYREGVVAKELSDQFHTSADALEATLRADRAAIDNANAAIQADKAARENALLQLAYCFISSPMNGRTGNLIVHQGNVVKANDLALVTINQIQPIYVTFTVPEQNLPEIKRAMATHTLEVRAVVPKEEKDPERGTLTFVDNMVDAATGTIRLKGTFINPNKRLWPGQFVHVVLILSTLPDAVVVPSRAVQTGQSGQYVFVIRPDSTVEIRSVTIGSSIQGEIIIERGLTPGETVVTDGQLRLVPGAKVTVKNGLDDSEAKGS
jgi:multidrug efflux system membrane fusion protein